MGGRKLIDMTGQAYGKMTVVRLINTTKGSLWECRCECGNVSNAYGHNLRTGNTTSCGCVKIADKPHRQVNLTGHRFGKLVALSIVPRKAAGQKERRRWMCQCDCGNEKVVTAQHLTSGETISCGCVIGQAPIRPRHIREKTSIATHKRRAVRAGLAPGGFTLEDIDALFKLQKGKCALCPRKLDPDSYHKDHKVALVRGGPNVVANIQLCCAPCARSKYTKTNEEFLRSRGQS